MEDDDLLAAAIEEQTRLLARAETAERERDQARAERDAAVDLVTDFLDKCDCNFGDGGTLRENAYQFIHSPATAARTRRIAALEELYAALDAYDKVTARALLHDQQADHLESKRQRKRLCDALAKVRECPAD